MAYTVRRPSETKLRNGKGPRTDSARRPAPVVRKDSTHLAEFLGLGRKSETTKAAKNAEGGKKK